MTDLRNKLLEQKVLSEEGGHLVLTMDYVFDSPSSAAGVMLGRSANGRIEWKDKAGRTLKDIQQDAIQGGRSIKNTETTSRGGTAMPTVTVRGTLERFGKDQWNVLVRNVEEMRSFWSDHNIDTKTDWAGKGPPKATVSRKELVARCEAAGEGAEVEYDLEVRDRSNARGVDGVDLRVVAPASGGGG